MTKVSNGPLISVIVPVYKVEKYLDKCVKSILNQTYKNLEVILVDDGSPDKCPEMCDNYSKNDKRVKVIHKQNGGLSDARNFGIEVAEGEYVTFVDSDDSLKDNFIEYLYRLVEDNNVLISVAPYIVVTDKKVVTQEFENLETVMNQKEAISNMILDKGFTVSACSKLFSKSLFNDISFPVGRLFEDTATTYKLILKCDKVAYGKDGGYYYYKREDSIINSSYSPKQLDFIEFTDKMGEEIVKKFPDLENVVESKKIDARFSVLRRMVMSDNLSDDDVNKKKEIKEYIKQKRKIILKSDFGKKIKFATVLISVGEPIFKFFWVMYSKIKY